MNYDLDWKLIYRHFYPKKSIPFNGIQPQSQSQAQTQGQISTQSNEVLNPTLVSTLSSYHPYSQMASCVFVDQKLADYSGFDPLPLGALEQEVHHHHGVIAKMNLHKEDLFKALSTLDSQGHFFNQVEALRYQLGIEPTPEHFLIEFLRSKKFLFLPERFGVYLALRCASEIESFLILVEKKEIKSIKSIEFSSYMELPEVEEKRKRRLSFISSLQKQMGVPIEGFFLEMDYWKSLSLCAQPWDLLSKWVKKEPYCMVPGRKRVKWFLKWMSLIRQKN